MGQKPDWAGDNQLSHSSTSQDLQAASGMRGWERGEGEGVTWKWGHLKLRTNFYQIEEWGQKESNFYLEELKEKYVSCITEFVA